MSAVDSFHITDAYLDWDKAGNDVVKGRRKMEANLRFEAILYVPGLAWARLHDRNSKGYPHVTEFCYETMSNVEGWSTQEGQGEIHDGEH